MGSPTHFGLMIKRIGSNKNNNSIIHTIVDFLIVDQWKIKKMFSCYQQKNINIQI